MESLLKYVFIIMLIIRFSHDLNDRKKCIRELGTIKYEMSYVLNFSILYFSLPILLCLDIVFFTDYNKMIQFINGGILLILNGLLSYLIFKYISIKNALYTKGIVFIETAIDWKEVVTYKFEPIENSFFSIRKLEKTRLVFSVSYKHQKARNEKKIHFTIESNQIDSINQFMETTTLVKKSG